MQLPLHRLMVLALAVSSIAMTAAVHAQMRGAPPGSIPGPPPGIQRGIPGGIPAGLPGGPPPGRPAHGAPAWVDEDSHHAVGLDQADAVRPEKLSKPEEEKAAALAKASPGTYELDRNGALVIRGEVLVSGLGAAELARLQQAGFSILRRNDIPDLGISLAVVMRDDLLATRAIKILRRIEPRGIYALNHVLFESGRRGAIASHRPTTAPAAPVASANDMTRIGLIDTGVAAHVEADRRIRVLRRNFAPSESTPELHGTAVAALLGRAPGRVTVYAADIFGSGPRGGTSELLIRALGWMASEHVPVVNVSMVGPANDIVGSVTETLIRRGFTIVAPVGNDGTAARPMYPASYPGVVAVSAAGETGRLLPEASRVRRVDFVAPGVATVLDVSGRATIVRGTSFAAPIVSRLIADRIRTPDPGNARRAIELLAHSAVRPKSEREWFGRGLVGEPTLSR